MTTMSLIWANGEVGMRLVIIGAGERAAIAFEHFRHDSLHEVVAFSIEVRHISADAYCGLPLVPLEDLTRVYPPEQFRTFVAVPPSQLNRVRTHLYAAVKSAGYTCVSYVSSRAFVASNVHIGENTFVHERAALQHMARIGENVVVGSGTCVGHSTAISDDCFIGQRVAISGLCRIGRRSFLGANSCVADDISIAEDCLLRPGAAVLKDTETRQVYAGNPARPEREDSFAAMNVADS